MEAAGKKRRNAEVSGDRLSRMAEARLRIAPDLDVDDAPQWGIDGACSLTGTWYGKLFALATPRYGRPTCVFPDGLPKRLKRLSGMAVVKFMESNMGENIHFALSATTVDNDGIEREEARFFQRPDDRLRLHRVDSDARWRTVRFSNASGLRRQENTSVDQGKFILFRQLNHTSEKNRGTPLNLYRGLPQQGVRRTVPARQQFQGS